jgi:glutathione synthase/RimK-type ligase-like ATP-grasp enzyme
VTNNLARAREFADLHGGAVIKTLAAGYFALSDQSFMFTTDLDEVAIDSPNAFRVQPMVVQRRLTRAWDLRVIVVGEWVVAARARTTGSDWRLNQRVSWEPANLPRAVIRASTELVRTLGLRYAAIDLVDDGESLWFLEANQAGEFHFLDRPLELGIAEAIADELSSPS